MSDRPDETTLRRHALLDALRAEIGKFPPHAYGAAAQWTVEEGLKALAHTHGTQIAAEVAYRLADQLATAGSVAR